MKIMAMIGLMMIGIFGGVCIAAAPPDTLTLADLVNRPDRWPATVTVPQDMHFTNGAVVHAGDKAKVVVFDGRRLGLAVGRIQFVAAPQDVGFLDAANQQWAALTVPQRAIDPESLPDDQSLWPVKIALTGGINCGFGRLPAGTEVSLLGVTKQSPIFAWPNSNNRVSTDFNGTDIINRARKLVLIDPAQRPSRIAAALDGIMIDADGKPYHDEHLQDKKFFALYFGAGWCPPCRTFSPDLVKFATDALPRHPELAIVLLSNEHQPQDTLAYMKDEKMPFPAVQPAQLDQCSLLTAYASTTKLIPHFVVVDRFGKVLVDNTDGQGNLTDTSDAIATLQKLLSAPAVQ